MRIFEQLKPQYRKFRPRLWADRLIIWLGAVLSGLAVVAFIHMTDFANQWFADARTESPWLPLLITPLGGVIVVFLTRRFFEGSAGSGIPQVIAALSPEMPPEGKRLVVSIPLAIGKMILSAAAMLAGFSTGREGPCCQISAGVQSFFHRFIIHKSVIRERDLMLAGGAAGIAAAFNAPLAEVVFAIEELSKRFEERSSGVLITGIVISGLVAVSLMGNLNYFGRVPHSVISAELILPGFLVTVAAGLLGGLFSWLMNHSFNNKRWRINKFRGRHPLWFAGGCGLVVAVLGLLSGGAAYGSGYVASQHLLSNQGGVPIFYFAVKFMATWISFWSGIPGGLFAPSLAVGAGLGHDISLLTSMVAEPTLIAMGMCGFLAAVTQAPITSFIIVMEMTDGHSMVLSLMACALLASMISHLMGEPLYPALARLQLKRVETWNARRKAAAPAPAPAVDPAPMPDAAAAVAPGEPTAKPE